MTTVYLAYGTSGRETLLRHACDEPVSLLVAVPFLGDFMKHRHNFNIKKWCLDSGAFTAYNSGKPMEYSRWLDAAKGSDADEVFGLDVIGNANATRANIERAATDGIKVMPTYHYGEPWDALEWCKQFGEKFALGGAAKIHHSRRLRWVAQCFARAWPCRVHGFACASREALQTVPFHSVDASSWSFAPSAMGAWCGFTGKQVSLRCRGIKDFWVEALEHQKREREAAWRWRRELEKMEIAI